jgi:hypothetical protein
MVPIPVSESVSPQRERAPQRVALPGDIGWAIEKTGPRANMHPIDFVCTDYPKDRPFLKNFDTTKANLFPRAPGSTAASLDEKLGINIELFKAMNR